MDTNTEALELLRQIAADTRASREAIEKIAARPDMDAQQVSALAQAVGAAMQNKARQDLIRLVSEH